MIAMLENGLMSVATSRQPALTADDFENRILRMVGLRFGKSCWTGPARDASSGRPKKGACPAAFWLLPGI